MNASTSSLHLESANDRVPGQSQSVEVAFGLNVAHNLTQIMLGGVIVSALLIPNMVIITGSYSQHILLCTLGYFFLMTQAILIFSPFGWASHIKYEYKRTIHFTMQILGSLLVITGSAVRMANINSHFTSGHGVCGFIAMLLTICTLVGGLLNWIFPRHMNTKLAKFVHACLGAATILFAFIAIIYAFHYYYRSAVGDRNANNAIVFAVFSLIGTLLMASIKHVRQILGT